MPTTIDFTTSWTETVAGEVWSPFDEACTDLVVLNETATTAYQPLAAGNPTDNVAIIERVFYQYIPNPLHLYVVDTITVASTVIGNSIRGVYADGTVTDTIEISVDVGRSVVDTLAINDFVSYFMASSTWVNPATPTPTRPGNAGTPGFPWDPGNPRVAGKIALTLGATTVHLRFPDFGDTDSYDTFRISRKSRGGDLQIFQDPMWPTTEVLSFKFSFLDPTDVSALIDFLKTSAGQNITLLDHFGRTWHGFIITPAGDVVNDKRTTSTAAFKFQPTSGPT